MSIAVFENIWESVKVKCPYCGTIQTEKLVTNVSSAKRIECFYCHKKFYGQKNYNSEKIIDD